MFLKISDGQGTSFGSHGMTGNISISSLSVLDIQSLISDFPFFFSLQETGK